MAQTNRAAALAKLAELGARTGEQAAPAEDTKVTRTGEEVYAGGDVARLLVRPAHLTYRKGDELLYAAATPGDTILVTATQAKRLDELGATIDADATEDEVEEAGEDNGKATDEQLGAMSAADLVAYVGQHPDERERVNKLELDRDNPRVTVLKATEVDEDEAVEEFDPEDEA